MNIEELKAELLGRTYPEKVKINVDHVVTDVPLFLKVSFIEVDKWTKDIEKCPAWVRLMRFRAVINSANQSTESVD